MLNEALFACIQDKKLSVQVAKEWMHAREEAAQAKAAGDKDRQKNAGISIRDLKAEMAQLGLCMRILEAAFVCMMLPDPCTFGCMISALDLEQRHECIALDMHARLPVLAS